MDILIPTLRWILPALSLFSALVVILLLLLRRTRESALATEEMTAQHFVICKSRRMIESNLLMVLLGAGGSVYMLFFLPEEINDFVIEVMVLFAVLLIAVVTVSATLQTINGIFWRCTVQGNEFTHRSLFRGERTFTLQEIRRVRVYRFLEISEPLSITLYSENRRLFTVWPHGVDHAGYHMLITRLKERQIAGREDLPEAGDAAQHYALVKGLDLVGRILLALQPIFVIIGAGLVMVALDSDVRFLADARTALEVLIAYQAWGEALIRNAMVAAAVVVFGNLAVILFVKGTRRFVRAHAWFAGVGTAAILVLSIGMVLLEDIPGAVQNAEADIAAIEQGELEMTTLRTNLDTEHERLWPLLPTEAWVVYRLHLSLDPYYVNFPMALRPSDIREALRDGGFRIPGEPPNVRIFEIWYTPNLHLVVEIRLPDHD